MRVLLIRTSSMGDILHTFPGLTDLQAQRPDIELDWVVETGFADMANWHPGVSKVLPIAQRRWLKQRNYSAWKAWRQWRKTLRTTEYDAVIDSQGLMKSALLARQARSAQVHGYHPDSARERLSGRLYSKAHRIDPNQHAVTRARQLFAQVFNYDATGDPEFGIRQTFVTAARENPDGAKPVLLIPGTTWHTKHWHPAHWEALAKMLVEKATNVEIIWGSEKEKALADSIIAACPAVTTSKDRLSIKTVTQKLAHAKAVVGPDTGFSHIAGALGTPTLALYGPTSSTKVGLIGTHTRNESVNLNCSPCHKRTCKWLPEDSIETPPCMRQITPEQVATWVDQQLTHSRITS